MKIIFTFILVSFTFTLFSQSYIGKTKDQVTTLVPKEMPGFAVNTFGKNPNVNSLKFYDSKKDRSLIFFFDDNDKCTYYKLIEDVASYDVKVAELNKSYTAAGKDKWSAKSDGKNVIISIQKSEYLMTVLYTL